MTDIVRPAEMEKTRLWLRDAWPGAAAGGAARFPVSFDYGGRASASLLGGWTARREPTGTRPGATYETITLTDPETGLECRCEITVYAGFPAVEWVVYFKNTGAADTPIIANILPLDVLLPLAADASCRVHHARGGLTQHDDFAPLETPLTFRQGGGALQMVARTGKSSTLQLPFFNLELGNGGVIGAIGWSGGWRASFQRQTDGIHVEAGMERTHLMLHPGEEIRTPRILLLFWEGDRVRSQNMLRRLILAYHTPRPDGELLQPPFSEAAWGARSAASHLASLAWLRDQHIPADCYWIDAGWYGNRPVAAAADALGNVWAREVGSWLPKADAYPDGLRPVGEAAAAAGMRFLLWLEPERVFEGSAIHREHPEWLLGPLHSEGLGGDMYMINLGLPAARRGITELVSGIIRKAGIGCYRQDFNALVVPRLFDDADGPNRVGMTEIRHIEGLYAFWDELLARHPGLIIDNCAGGGQRIDLESISRSVPLWRSDYQCWPFDPQAMQTQTQGLAPWVPLSAAVCEQPTRYALRSALGAGLVTHWSSQTLEGNVALPLEEVRSLMGEALAMRKYFYGDFYPLLAFSLAADAWAAWQYDRPDLGEGMLVAFRRSASPFASGRLALQGLDPEGSYEICSHDDGATWRADGRSLLDEGLKIDIANRPGSALFVYRRLA